MAIVVKKFLGGILLVYTGRTCLLLSVVKSKSTDFPWLYLVGYTVEAVGRLLWLLVLNKTNFWV